jgi:type II restriction enzyme
VSLNSKDKKLLLESLERLTPAQLHWIKAAIFAFDTPRIFWRASDSNLVTQSVLDNLGDRLLSHHANSRQSLSKDRFEFALEAALNASNISSRLVASRTNRGHDITVLEVPVSLKTEAAKSIKEDSIHVSKWMELGKGKWDLPRLRDLFLEHMQSYERIYTLRCLASGPTKIRYELVEIPKSLMLEAKQCEFRVCKNSMQKPKPGYGYIKDASGNIKFELYFDGGTERKLQIKHLRKDLCKLHATWEFELTALK